MLSWYFIRITSDFTSKKLLSQLFTEPYLISKEYSKRMKLHYHIVHQTTMSKDQLKTLIYDHLPSEAKKGIHTLKIDLVGDTQTDLETACTYTVKDGDFIYSEFFTELIDKFVENSYEKTIPYPRALKSLISEYTEDIEYNRIDWHKLRVKIAILRAKYGLNIFKANIYALVLSVQIRHNHNVAEELFSCS